MAPSSTDDQEELQHQQQQEQRRPATLALVPMRQTKTIHFIRHGQGFHNVAGHADHEEYKNEAYFDAHLTEEGWKQAEALNAHIRSTPGLKVDLVVVSPLTRALETAVGAFRGRCAAAAFPMSFSS